MLNNEAELLIDHLDNSMLGKGSPEVDQLIGADANIAESWRTLNMAVDMVRNAALHERVMAVRKAWMARETAAAVTIATPSKTRVFTMYRNVMRVAACVLVMAGGAAVYKYTTTSSAGIYQEYYASYELTTSRGASAADPIDHAYNNKNWAMVLALFNTIKDKTTRSFFLAGMADLELKNYNAAIAQFTQVMAENMRTGTDYFQDEAEYYMAMSLLAANQANQALPLLEKIKANPYHLYHQKVAAMSFIDLKIVSFKSHK